MKNTDHIVCESRTCALRWRVAKDEWPDEKLDCMVILENGAHVRATFEALMGVAYKIFVAQPTGYEIPYSACAYWRPVIEGIDYPGEKHD